MITNENYYQPNNKGLSQSKIKSYLQCPNYFYRRHILGEVEIKSDAFTIGGAVDDLLTDIDNIDKNKYVVVSRRNLKSPPTDYIEMNQKQYDEILSIASAVENTSAYKFIKEKFIFQEIVQVPADLGKYFSCYLGKPDAYYIDDKNHLWLVDLKTAATVDNKRYFYNAQSYYYFQQLWFYAFLLKLKYPHIKTLSYWHLAVEKKEPFNVKLFRIPNLYVENCESHMLSTIQTIAADTEFKKADASFTNPTPLINPKDDSEYEWEE
jgi:hypothetical protein